MFLPRQTTIFHQTLSVPETLLGVGRLLPYQLGWRCDVAIIWAKILQATKKIPTFVSVNHKEIEHLCKSQHNIYILPTHLLQISPKKIHSCFFQPKKSSMSRQRYCFKALEFMRKVSTKFSCQPSRAPDLGRQLGDLFFFGPWILKDETDVYYLDPKTMKNEGFHP